MTLTAEEQHLLQWLGASDVSQYGECYGKAFDALIEKGLAEFMSKETETANPFIAKGHGMMYRAVRLTERGRAVLAG
jgi:hypothetical protein